jgi:hypothetical protein
MNHTITDNLMLRVKKLESQLRWQQRFFALLIAASILATVAIAAAQSRDVTATSFTVIDRNGKKRATIGINRGGGVAFSVFSPRGELDVALGDTADGNPYLALYGKKKGKINEGEVQASLIVSDGEPSLALRDKSGEVVFSVPGER